MPQEPSAARIHGRDFPAGAVAFEEGGLRVVEEPSRILDTERTRRFEPEDGSRSAT